MKQLLLTICLTAACLTAGAQTIEQTLLSMHKEKETFVAPFIETTVMPKMKKETVKKGTMYFAAPDALLMKYSDPAGDYSLIKDGKFNVKRKANVQSVPMNPKNMSQLYTLRETLLGSLTGDLKRVAEENEAEVSCKEAAGKYHCTLTKKQPKAAGVNTLELIYDKRTGALLSLKLIQANGNYTVYDTPDIKSGVSISADTWNVQAK